MKGIILAGGHGSRLYPITKGISKQLLPIYDKPMIYYPLSVLMLAGIKDVLIITTSEDQGNFRRVLGDGSHLGIRIEFAIQDYPDGLAQAFILGEEFIGNDRVCLILGDNIFWGQGFIPKLEKAANLFSGATIFGYRVKDPSRFGVAEINHNGKVLNITEKPSNPSSNIAVTGLYFYDNSVIDIAKKLKPSLRGELEITSINQIYLDRNELNIEILGRGLAWLDTGTYESLLEASMFVETIEKRQGLMVACIEEIAWRKNWISKSDLQEIAKNFSGSPYGNYLLEISSKELEN